MLPEILRKCPQTKQLAIVRNRTCTPVAKEEYHDYHEAVIAGGSGNNDHICQNVGEQFDGQYQCSLAMHLWERREFPDNYTLIDSNLEAHLYEQMRCSWIRTAHMFMPSYASMDRYVYDVEQGKEVLVSVWPGEYFSGYEDLMELYLEKDINPIIKRERGEKDVHDFLWSWDWYRDVLVVQSGIQDPYNYEPFFFPLSVGWDHPQ